MTRTCAWALAALFVLGSAATAFADGRTEINQASVDAAGGFPVTISVPGSYVLTSDLRVPVNSHGVILAANEVTLDLNGFAIFGPATCDTGSCVAGSFAGISFANISTGRRVTVRNGTVRGFSSTCVSLRSEALVERLLVTECGVHGISVLGGSVVLRNRVVQTGLNGISMIASKPPPTYAHNTISGVSLGVAGFHAVEGGRASAGNSCEDGGCSPNGQRRFYLTSSPIDGGSAATACAFGFRVAAQSELLETSTLHYDQNLGASTPAGLPVFQPGWLYVTLSGSHCGFYASTSGSGATGSFQLAAPDSASWTFNNITACTSTMPVWCIEE